MEKNGKDKLAW